EGLRRTIKYDNDKNPATQNLYAIHKLHKRDSLLLASEKGMMYFDIKTKVWTPCLPEVFKANTIIGRDFFEDVDGIVWISTEGAGLVRMDYSTQDVEIIQKVLHISRNSRYVFKDGNHFWIATDNGVVVYNYQEDEVVKHIHVDD